MYCKRYIVLLRGVNVGRAKRVAMGDLCKLIAGLGYADVRSVQNSGNVVFSSAPLSPAEAARTIEEELVLKLGVAARVFVLDREELDAIVNDNPLLPLARDHSRLLVFLLPDSGVRDQVAPLCEREWGGDAVALGRRVVYLWCAEGILQSAAAAALGKELGDATTSRNWNTILKLHSLCGDPRA